MEYFIFEEFLNKVLEAELDVRLEKNKDTGGKNQCNQLYNRLGSARNTINGFS